MPTQQSTASKPTTYAAVFLTRLMPTLLTESVTQLRSSWARRRWYSAATFACRARNSRTPLPTVLPKPASRSWTSASAAQKVYFATFSRLDGGIMVTASHNPNDYNGLKMVHEQSRPVSADTGLKDIRALAEGDECATAVKKPARARTGIFAAIY